MISKVLDPRNLSAGLCNVDLIQIQTLRGLSKMLYGSEDHDDKENLEGDPYLEDETDPSKCRAAESSLWEVVALQNHVLPQV